MTDNFLTARQVCARFGEISSMTLWRWLHDPKLGFPQPLVINRRRLFRIADIEAFEARAAKAGEAI
jgi:predicted DNA-binding transcriptional regulator AlpA